MAKSLRFGLDVSEAVKDAARDFVATHTDHVGYWDVVVRLYDNGYIASTHRTSGAAYRHLKRHIAGTKHAIRDAREAFAIAPDGRVMTANELKTLIEGTKK